MSSNLILALSANRLPAVAHNASFIPMSADAMWRTLHDAGLWLGPRAELEQLETFRQVIPYVVLKSGERFVKYIRSASGGERRLHDRVSIGVGGHVDLSDVVFYGETIDIVKTLEGAARREVTEEIAGVETISGSWEGLLIDNSNPVGRVHIGAVAVWELASVPKGAAESAIAEAGMATLPEISAAYGGRLETWSELLVRHWLR